MSCIIRQSQTSQQPATEKACRRRVANWTEIISNILFLSHLTILTWIFGNLFLMWSTNNLSIVILNNTSCRRQRRWHAMVNVLKNVCRSLRRNINILSTNHDFWFSSLTAISFFILLLCFSLLCSACDCAAWMRQHVGDEKHMQFLLQHVKKIARLWRQLWRSCILL